MKRAEIILPAQLRKQLGKEAKTIQDLLRKQLGEDAKTILNKIDRMLAHKRKRKYIETMMAAEIAACTRKRLEQFCVILT